MPPGRYQTPIYSELSSQKLMKISAEINEEWEKRKLLDLNAPTEISKALGVRSPGQLEIELSRFEHEVQALRARVAELFAFVVAVKGFWSGSGESMLFLQAEANRLTRPP